MGRLIGQSVQEARWTGDNRHFTSSSTSLRKDASLAALGSPRTMLPSNPQNSNSPWTSNFGLQTGTTQPRPVFSTQTSYTYKPSSSIPQRQPSTSEFYMPRSNSDLLVGTIDQRDPYAMETPLTTALDMPLPPPPPVLSGGRLGAIIALYVFFGVMFSKQAFFAKVADIFTHVACWEACSSPSWTPRSSQPA